ncbi:hypothetical protein BLOT_005114 [Blomia tropicalis]|nr:hypothetical protein BLOT_005114 [Blomia tropicalis]
MQKNVIYRFITIDKVKFSSKWNDIVLRQSMHRTETERQFESCNEMKPTGWKIQSIFISVDGASSSSSNGILISNYAMVSRNHGTMSI